MRVPRIKESGEGFYHSMSRVVDRRMVLDDKEKEKIPAAHAQHRGIQWRGRVDALNSG